MSLIDRIRDWWRRAISGDTVSTTEQIDDDERDAEKLDPENVSVARASGVDDALAELKSLDSERPSTEANDSDIDP